MKTIENGRISIEKTAEVREGVFLSEDGSRADIVIWCKDSPYCKLCLYINNRLRYRIVMYPMSELGAEDLFGVRLRGEELSAFLKECQYNFENDQGVVNDPYMKMTAGRSVFGRKGKLRGRFCLDSFDWSGEGRSMIPYDEMILYQCHLRGYTKHSSSGVKAPGTFAGFMEKLDYISGLGVNTILFQPIYDFNEIMDTVEKKVNYWGYTKDACYFAPKASYAADADHAVEELKELIKQIHQRGMNLFLDMHFENQMPEFILRCLRYYMTEYHIDGFLVNPEVIRKEWLEADPLLRQCRFLGSYWQEAGCVGGKKKFAAFNDEYMTVARRFLKSDEGQVENFFRLFKADDANMGRVHYITQKNGFTLRDLVSYDVKHNEANGERNNDGTEFNFSWNCGQEGTSRKRAVNNMRYRQTKNALCMLFLSLASPMLLAGDEFGRTQKGNNNAYCQDNNTTWIDWRLLEKNEPVYEMTRKLIKFRKQTSLYKRQGTLSGMDTLGVGAPGVSAHGVEPWEADFSYYSRGVGILFYGTYYEGKSLYMAFNFHWDAHTFYLPVINEKKTWKVLFDTARDELSGQMEALRKYILLPRSIVIFECEDVLNKKKGS